MVSEYVKESLDLLEFNHVSHSRIILTKYSDEPEKNCCQRHLLHTKEDGSYIYEYYEGKGEIGILKETISISSLREANYVLYKFIDDRYYDSPILYLNMHILPIMDDDIIRNRSKHKGYYYVGRFKVSVYKTVGVFIRVSKDNDCKYDYIIEND